MDSRKLILLVGALVVAAITAFMARSLIAGSPAPQAAAVVAPPVDGPQVLVATRPLPVGTILDATALKFQPWPKDLVDGAYYLKDTTNLQSLQGTVVRFAITAGQPVTQGALVKPGDRGFLAAALAPGMRAVTLPIAGSNSVAGFVFPGDHVDLVLTQTVAGGGNGPPLKVSETIMRNLRVLATDQSTSHDTDETGKTVVKSFSNVTVEATPKLAEKVAVAQTLGTLSLSLRSIADTGEQLIQSIPLGKPGEPGAAQNAVATPPQIASDPIAGDTTFATGADVSRFQRRTVPAGTPALPSAPGAVPGPTAYAGPVVRVARGNTVTEVPVGGKN